MRRGVTGLWFRVRATPPGGCGQVGGVLGAPPGLSGPPLGRPSLCASAWGEGPLPAGMGPPCRAAQTAGPRGEHGLCGSPPSCTRLPVSASQTRPPSRLPCSPGSGPRWPRKPGKRSVSSGSVSSPAGGCGATVGPTGCSEAPGARRQRGRASRAPAPRRPSPLASLCSLRGQAPVTCLGPCGALARPERLTAFIPRGSGWLRPHCPSRVSPGGPPPAWAAVSAPRSAAFCGGQLSVPSLMSLRPSTQPRSARRARWLWDGPARSRGGEGHRRHGACAGPCGSPGASTGS